MDNTVSMPKADDNRKLQTAMSLHQAGNLKKAGALYRQLIERNPANLYALHNLGLLEASIGNHAQAKSLFARALSAQPLNVKLIDNYATMLFKMGEYEPAVDTCRRAVRGSGLDSQPVGRIGAR